MSSKRIGAAEAFARALRNADSASASFAARHCAESVVFECGGTTVVGREAVELRLREIWPFTPVLARGVWTSPEVSNDLVRVNARFDTLGAAPRNYRIEFAFDDEDRIAQARETFDFPSKGERQSHLPDYVKSAIDRALADGRPIAVSHVTKDGAPSLSLRGSIQVWDDMELCGWIRNPASGLAEVARNAGLVSLLYRDSSTRTTMVISARARLVEDPTTREAIYNRIPEVEQTHDPARKGAAILLAIDKLVGTHPLGALNIERAPERRA